MSAKNTTTNDHIKSYLDYYLTLAYPPQYAVLINGAWGIGKTFFIKRFLEEYFKNDGKYCYVSLYGATDTEDIDNAVLEAIYPMLGNEGVKVAGKVAKAAMKYFKIETDIKLSGLIKNADIKAFVFDDFERSLMSPNKALGYINEIVEHDNGKVIIIANEKELAKDESYTRCREKLIGKTLELQSSFEEAFVHFVSKIDHKKAQKILSNHEGFIAEIYNQSELHNLRILKQTMWDFERLISLCPAKYYDHASAIKDLIGLFFAISMEFKAGRISENDLRNRMNKIVAAQLNKDPNKVFPLYIACNRYEIKLYHDIVSDEVLVNLLVKGIFDRTKIEELFDKSPYFSAQEEPAWRTVWYGMDKTDAEFQPALKTMEQQFKERKFTLPGEIAHVFGLRLWLADIGAINIKLWIVVTECKKYVDDLYARKTLEPTAFNGNSDLRFDGYGGLAIFRAETKEFKDVFEYLQAKREQAEKDSYRDIGNLLLQEMVNPNKFYELLCYTRNGNNLYAHVPVLATIKPKRFVEELLKHSPKVQRDLVHTFRGRYQAGSIESQLKEEKAWLESLRKELIKATKGLSPLHKHRILNDIKHNIAPVLRGN